MYLKENKMVFIDYESFKPIEDQWNYLSKIEKLSNMELDELYLEIVKDKKLYSFNIAEGKKLFKTDKLSITLKNQIVLEKVLSLLLPPLIILHPNFFCQISLSEAKQ